MPPRKSDVSKAGTGDEATAAKEALVRDGINIEVYIPIPPQSNAPRKRLSGPINCIPEPGHEF
jgi:hypothetical protein